MATTSPRRIPIAIIVALACLFAEARAWAASNAPGEFDYYVLVLSWTPSYCEREGRARQDRQCDAPQPRAFTLHGLWPQFEKGWPENCAIGRQPWVSANVIEEMRDIMPSKSLIIHEYRTHGTCSGLEPAQYFGVARELYERVNVPPRFLAGAGNHLVSAEEIEHAFADANSWLKPEMIAVSCRDESLLDIRVCFGRDLFPRACGENEDEKRLCPASKIAVPPAAP